MKLLKKGIKDNSGQYFPVRYSKSILCGKPIRIDQREAITIYAKNYERFSEDIRKEVLVENDSDSMTDYFEPDRIVIEKENPLFTVILNKGFAK